MGCINNVFPDRLPSCAPTLFWIEILKWLFSKFVFLLIDQFGVVVKEEGKGKPISEKPWQKNFIDYSRQLPLIETVSKAHKHKKTYVAGLDFSSPKILPKIS